MPTQVAIEGWESTGLRCPDHKISFLTSANNVGVHAVSLIQMPNGTGKTTTLQLLRMALSGSPLESDFDIKDLQKRNSVSQVGRFRVSLIVDGRRISFALDFDFEAGVVTRSTTLPGGNKEGFHPTPEIVPFLRPGFVRFLIFDGELADALVKPGQADAQHAIEYLFHLTTFTRLSSAIGDYWDKETLDKTATEARGFSRRRNEVKKLKERIEKLERDRKGLVQKQHEAKERLGKLEASFADALSKQKEVQTRLLDAQQQLQAAEKEAETCVSEIVATIKNPCAFSSVVSHRVKNLKEILDEVKLPESAAKEFFIELSQQSVCVCGRPLDEGLRSAIVERAQQYLGSEEVSFLNEMKGRIADASSPDPRAAEQVLLNSMENLRHAIKRLSERKTKRDAIEVEGASGDPALIAVQTEISHLRERVGELKGDLDRFDDPTDSARPEDTHGLAVLRRRLTMAENKFAEITDTLKLKRQRDILLKILAEAHSLSQQALSSELTKEANLRISQLMPDNRVRIERIRDCLMLEGQQSGSTGENLTVAYAFLSTLFSSAHHRLPFVVDSPANPIDLQVRRQVAKLVPRLGHQFVAFTISSEREGFLSALEGACDDIQYLTLFRRGYEALGKKNRDFGQETLDGVLVPGREFFGSFHLDVEAGG